MQESEVKPQVQEVITEEKKPAPVLKLLPGGKGPPDQESHFWLRNIPAPWAFVTCRKGEIGCATYQIMQHRDKTTIMFDLDLQRPVQVHTARFSNMHERLEVLPVVPAEENENGNGNTSEPGVVEDTSPTQT